jgi:hypothetical protein
MQGQSGRNNVAKIKRIKNLTTVIYTQASFPKKISRVRRFGDTHGSSQPQNDATK